MTRWPNGGTENICIHHTPYLAHHARAISGAAVFSDAAHIELGIMFKKQRVAPAPVDGETDRI